MTKGPKSSEKPLKSEIMPIDNKPHHLGGRFNPDQKWAIITEDGKIVATCRNRMCCESLKSEMKYSYYQNLEIKKLEDIQK